VSAEPPGASRWQALGGLSWSVPAVDGLSLDTQVNHFSSRRVRSDRDMRTPAYTTVDLGALHNFTVGKTAMTLRLRIINLFDSDAWVAQRSELLDRVGRRGVRLTLSVRGRS
jgi:iron complex outermembrane receptor protein